MKRRNELNMKPAAVIHMLSPRNFKIGSYTRSPHVGGLATVSRHPAVVHWGGGVSIYVYACMYFCMLVGVSDRTRGAAYAAPLSPQIQRSEEQNGEARWKWRRSRPGLWSRSILVCWMGLFGILGLQTNFELVSLERSLVPQRSEASRGEVRPGGVESGGSTRRVTQRRWWLPQTLTLPALACGSMPTGPTSLERLRNTSVAQGCSPRFSGTRQAQLFP